MKSDFDNTASVILAAGSSSRLGKSKQLLFYKDDFLINYVINQLEKVKIINNYLVLGAFASDIKKIIKSENIRIITNDKWENGIGSSIKTALLTAKKEIPDLDSISFHLSDQYKINSEHIRNLFNHFNKAKDKIICSNYQSVWGVPAIFPSKYFSEILISGDDIGCREIINNNRNNTIPLNFEDAGFDIDYQSDIKDLEISEFKQ